MCIKNQIFKVFALGLLVKFLRLSQFWAGSGVKAELLRVCASPPPSSLLVQEDPEPQKDGGDEREQSRYKLPAALIGRRRVGGPG